MSPHRHPRTSARRPVVPALLAALALGCGISGSDELADLRSVDREEVAEAAAGALFQGAALKEVLLTVRPALPPTPPPETIGDVTYIAFACDRILVNNNAERASQAGFIEGGVVFSGRADRGRLTAAACPRERWETDLVDFLIPGQYSLDAMVDFERIGDAMRFEASNIVLLRPQMSLDPDKTYIVPEPIRCSTRFPCFTDGPLPPEARRRTRSLRQPGAFVCEEFDTPGEACLHESEFEDTNGNGVRVYDLVVTGERATGYELAGRMEGPFGTVDLASTAPLDFECPFDCERCLNSNPPPDCTSECTEDTDDNEPNNDERPNAGGVTIAGLDGFAARVTYLDCDSYELCFDAGAGEACTTVAY